jgi:hypothetical protein
MSDTARFVEIDSMLKEASGLDLDIYDKLIRIYMVNGYVRPISIYIALLEDGKTYPLELENPRIETRMGCLMNVIKLAESDMLSCELEDGFYTEYTVFKLKENKNLEFDYFAKVVKSAMQELDNDRYSEIEIEARYKN